MKPEENPWYGYENADRFSAVIALVGVLTVSALIQQGAAYLGRLSANYFPTKPKNNIETVVTNNWLEGSGLYSKISARSLE